MEDATGGCFLGSEAFIAQCKDVLNGDDSLPEVPQAQRDAGRPKLEVLFANIPLANKPKRNKGIIKAYADFGHTMKAIGDHCGLHHTTVSKIISDAAQ